MIPRSTCCGCILLREGMMVLMVLNGMAIPAGMLYFFLYAIHMSWIMMIASGSSLMIYSLVFATFVMYFVGEKSQIPRTAE